MNRTLRMHASPAETALSALASLAIVILIAVALIFGLRAGWVPGSAPALLSVDFSAPPPQRQAEPQPPPRPAATSAPKGAPSPRNLKNKATAIVAPPLPLPPLILPPPIITAPVAGIGQAANNGASALPGPGQGAGGAGNGLGGGGNGGNGDGDGAATPPRQIKGKLSFADLPEGLLPPGSEAAVGVRYRVMPDGSAASCRVDKSSRIPTLDALACRLIEQRFRFRPARNRAGRAVPSTLVETHAWVIPPESP